MALLADRMTCSSVTGFVPAELMMGHLPLMPLEEDVCSWRMVGWQDQVLQADLLARRIEHFTLLPAKLEIARKRLKMVRLRNKSWFDRTHRLQPVEVKEGDWVLVFESRKFNTQHLTKNKFARRWQGPMLLLKRTQMQHILFGNWMGLFTRCLMLGSE